MYRVASCCIPWIVLMAVLASETQAQVTGANPKVITWQSPATTDANEIFVGILGEVSRPGVYHLDPQSLTLQNVIRRAGGITDEASRSIRIVRQDRVIQTVFFSPQTDGAILPGDLLIVESRRAQTAVSKMFESDPHNHAVQTSSSEPPRRQPQDTGVQLAFLNVIDRPVIVKVKHENASLLHVVQKLDQPIELAQAVRVISPERLLSQAAAQPVDTPIPDGSVLVFPKYSVNRNKLPPLPVPYESGIATGAFPSLIGGRAGQSPELRNVGQLPPLMARQFQDPAYSAVPSSTYEQSSIPLPPPSFNPIAPAPAEPRVEVPTQPAPVPVVSNSPRIATLPFSGAPRVTSSSTSKSISSDFTPADHPPSGKSVSDDHTVSRGEGKSRKAKPIEPRTFDEDAAEDLNDEPQLSTGSRGSTTALSIPLMIGIVGCLGLLIGLALLMRHRLQVPGAGFSRTDERATQVEVAAATASAAARPAAATRSLSPIHGTAAPSFPSTESTVTRSVNSRLDRLIHNELQIREERIEFPQQIVLQGRIVSPPVFRVDQAAASPLIHGPHFDAEDLSGSSSTTTVEIVPEIKVVTDELDRPHAGSPAKPHFMRRRPGENTVAAAAMAGSKTSPSNPPDPKPELKSSPTPLTDALRQLQGGQS